MIKSIYEKFTGNIIFDGKRLNIFSLRSGKRKKMPVFTTAVQPCTRSSS